MYKHYLKHVVLPTGITKKILLVMKLTALMLFIAFMQVSATTIAQKVTLSERNAPLSVVFEQIRTQTGYDFAYTTKTIQSAKPVTINVSNKNLKDVLDQIFDGQPLEYKIEDKSVTVSVKQPTILDKIKNYFAAMDVTGRVTDENNQPLSGATVQVKGGSNSTSTDASGFFTLKQVDPNAIIVISFLGYDKKEIPAQANVGAVKLSAAASKLDEVQVIAYGKQTQRLSVGNVSSVSAKDIEKQPVQNPLLAIQASMPGVYITQTNGLPGGGVKVIIQGQNSIANGNDPLYVIDGVPYLSELPPSSVPASIILGKSADGQVSNSYGYGNPMSYIDPSSIESISLLKDAEATAIYGSRAANGAILITTKKGKAGQMKTDINVQQGYGQVGHFMSLMNIQQYLQMRHEAKKNDGLNPYPSIKTTPNNTDYDINGLWDTTRNVNWQRELIGRTAHYTNAGVTISGGSNTTQYLIGGTYHNESTVFPGDFGDRKGSLHFSISSASANQRFRLQLTGNYMIDNNQMFGLDLTSLATRLAPDAPSLYNPDGSINWAPRPTGASSFSATVNPAAYLAQTYGNLTSNLISNMIMSYQILPGLDVNANFGYTNLQTNETAQSPLTAIAPENRPFSQRGGNYSKNSVNTWIIEPQINYHKIWGKHNIQALIGSTLQQNNTNLLGYSATGFLTDAAIANPSSGSTFGITSSQTTYKYNALFGRIGYNWDSKYLLSINARRDGSSRFGSANQFHNFGSLGVGWIFSEENFIKNNFSWMSFGKLRGSYGTTGSDQIGDYQFLSLYNTAFAGVPYQGISALTSTRLTNPYLQWEETRKLSLGLDLGFLKDRILFSASWFRNRSSNELLNYVLPTVTGFSGITENFPATIQNSGLELSLTSNNVKSNVVTWSTNFNLTLPHNKLLAFPNLASSSYANSFIIGQSINIVRVFHLMGVDPTTGQYVIADSHGNPTTAPVFPQDFTKTIDLNPQFYGGVNNHFGYRDFTLDFTFQFVKKTGLTYPFGIGSVPGASNRNQPIAELSRWQQPGDITSVQRYNSNLSIFSQWSNASSSDAAYGDVSYIRLKNLSISWQVPEFWDKKVGLKNARLFLEGQNLITITRYKGLDPETLSYTTLPPLRTIVMGLQIGL